MEKRKQDLNLMLGDFLRSARLARKLTLRAAEEATGISNAYLSQLESGKINQPSPNNLHKLSELYGVSYSVALECAGYPVPVSARDAARVGGSQFAARLGTTTPNEEEALLEYLDFLRSRRKTKNSKPDSNEDSAA